MASYLGQQMSLGTYNTGENGHVEYGWSEQMQEKIVQLQTGKIIARCEDTQANIDGKEK